MNQVFHLYIHLPFCSRRCSYCDFYSETSRLESAPAYINAAVRELEEFDLPPESLKTVYLGGGTPTLVGGSLLSRLLEHVLPYADPGAEVTIEANPSTIDTAMARTLREAGVTRVSMGAQSFAPRLRNVLGRGGSAATVGRAVICLRDAGFTNIGLDLIFGIPGQTMAELKSDLDCALSLEPEHVSCYELTLKEGTPFKRRWAAELKLMDESGAGAYFYEKTVEILESAGYIWYETSNFARPGYECRHNLAYWAGDDYLGIGAGAWSTVGRSRWRNAEDLDIYMTALGGDKGNAGQDAPATGLSKGSDGDLGKNLDKNPGKPLGKDLGGKNLDKTQGRLCEQLSREDKLREKLLLGLRRAQGVPSRAVASLIDSSAQNILLRNGFLTTEGDKILLTRAGRFLANEVCARLLK